MRVGKTWAEYPPLILGCNENAKGTQRTEKSISKKFTIFAIVMENKKIVALEIRKKDFTTRYNRAVAGETQVMENKKYISVENAKTKNILVANEDEKGDVKGTQRNRSRHL